MRKNAYICILLKKHPDLLPPPAHINPDFSRQFQNLEAGISTNPPIGQPPSIIQSPPNNLIQSLHQSRQNLTYYEHALMQIKNQVNAVGASRNIQQLQNIIASLAETQKKCKIEQEKWTQVLVNAQAQQWAGMDFFIRAIEEAVARAMQLCSQYELIGQRLEDALGVLQQQQRSLQNLIVNGGLSVDNGAGPQVSWNLSGVRNLSLNTQTPMPNHQVMNAAQNCVGTNLPNYNLGGANPATTFLQNLQAPQNHPSNRPLGTSILSNAAQNQSNIVKANFAKFLANVNIEPVIHLAGRTIEMWDLFHAVREFDTRFGRYNPAKFHMIGYQLGLPPDGQQTQTSGQVADALRDHYNRLMTALRTGGTNALRPAVVQQPARNILSSQTQNEMWLELIKINYPGIDFNNVPRGWITNLPTPQFYESLKKWIELQSMIGNGIKMDLPIIQSPGLPVQSNRNPPAVSSPNVTGPFAQMANQSDIMEIEILHEGLKQKWRAILETTTKAPIQPPVNIQIWKLQLRAAFNTAGFIVGRFGLYCYLFKDFQATHKVMTMSAYLVKQIQQPDIFILSQTDLEAITRWLQQQVQSLTQCIQTLQVTPELRPFIHPTDAETNTLGGFLSEPLRTTIWDADPTSDAVRVETVSEQFGDLSLETLA
ncbi:hypothetical protein CPB86DRAFT_786455 [Serendipita vermifera]|nr:hypothetical protein CPB86DRAFT_786455 [Serendipita vermifera]